MNQAIQVIDGFTYIPSQNAIQIEVMAAGQMLFCYIAGEDQQDLSSLYKTKQFEIEELIEDKITQDKLNEEGEIWLTTEEVTSY
jgi:hypothetical protein